MFEDEIWRIPRIIGDLSFTKLSNFQILGSEARNSIQFQNTAIDLVKKSLQVQQERKLLPVIALKNDRKILSMSSDPELLIKRVEVLIAHESSPNRDGAL